MIPLKRVLQVSASAKARITDVLRSCLLNQRSIRSAQTALRECEDGYDDPEWLFREEVSLYRLEYLRNLSDEERGTLLELRAPLLEDFEERFQLTEEELAFFRRMLAKDGYVPFSECERFLKERGREN